MIRPIPPGIADEIHEMDRLLILKAQLLKIATECAFTMMVKEISDDIAEIRRQRSALMESVR